MIGTLLIVMAICASVSGVAGYYRGVVPPQLRELIPAELERRFLADWWAHNASYGSGFLGGMVLWVVALRKRVKASRLELKEE